MRGPYAQVQVDEDAGLAVHRQGLHELSLIEVLFAKVQDGRNALERRTELEGTRGGQAFGMRTRQLVGKCGSVFGRSGRNVLRTGVGCQVDTECSLVVDFPVVRIDA